MSELYRNETCEACVRLGLCEMQRPYSTDKSYEICDRFRPSLLCRQVRALERLADYAGLSPAGSDWFHVYNESGDVR